MPDPISASAQPVCLIIAGYDPCGGGGVLVDLIASRASGVRAVAAVTAVTAQNTSECLRMTPVAAELLRDELELLAREFSFGAVKVGMIGDSSLAGVISDFLDSRCKDVPVVLDPVLAASAGLALFPPDRHEDLRRLFSRCTLITPNLPELTALSGLSVESSDALGHAARVLLASGARAVLVKGGHAEGVLVVDELVTTSDLIRFEQDRLSLPKIRGTGCFLSTAIACALLEGLPLASAVAAGRALLQEHLGSAWFPGGRNGLLTDNMK